MITRIQATLILIGLCLPAAAQQVGPVQPGWTKTETGCRVWNQSPRSAETARWSGACVDGYAEGQGILTWIHPKGDGTFQGQMAGGKANGRGFAVWPTGDRYDGEWSDGLKSGRGVYVWSNGDRYEGDWKNDKQDGRGVHVWASGSRYDGEWKDGDRNGQGAAVYANGTRYEGYWVADRPHGQGTYVEDTGQTYTGTWTNGCFKEGDRWAVLGPTPKECGFD